MNDTVEGRISVIATRMPYIDRRSLSEAWFSALHLADDGSSAAKPKLHGDVDAPSPNGRTRGSSQNVARDFPSHTLQNAFTATRTVRAGVEAPSRALPAAKMSRAQIAAFRARSYAPFRTSLTFGVDGDRVTLLLRREGAVLHVVALCRPAVADVVRKALASADLHLRASGDEVRARVETLPPEVVA